MEKELENIILRWNGKIDMVKKGIVEDQARGYGAVIGELT